MKPARKMEKAVLLKTAFFIYSTVLKQLFVFMTRLFFQLSVFVLRNLFPPLLNNAAHS